MSISEPPSPDAQQTTSEQDRWPAIVELNIDKAKNMLLGDKSLFLETLENLLIEYTNLSMPPQIDIDDAGHADLRLQIASQVHKLRSVSGMVGAERVQQLASEAEEIVRTESQSAKKVLMNLSLALQALQNASKEALDLWKEEKHVASTSDVDVMAPSLKLETVESILILLAEQDLSALDEVDEHSASLREALGNERFQQFQRSLARLDYKQAIAFLEPLIKRLGDT